VEVLVEEDGGEEESGFFELEEEGGLGEHDGLYITEGRSGGPEGLLVGGCWLSITERRPGAKAPIFARLFRRAKRSALPPKDKAELFQQPSKRLCICVCFSREKLCTPREYARPFSVPSKLCTLPQKNKSRPFLCPLKAL
jgi:hypothetical protein